jgi:hypothetical protein
MTQDNKFMAFCMEFIKEELDKPEFKSKIIRPTLFYLLFYIIPFMVIFLILNFITTFFAVFLVIHLRTAKNNILSLN